jgi:uncharacterized protein YdeI (YjbR/CyaY-like superfamily)
VRITLEADTEERVVEVPPGLEAVFLREMALREFFDSLSFTHRREYVNYILEAKREETRLRHVEKVVAMLKEGKKGI